MKTHEMVLAAVALSAAMAVPTSAQVSVKAGVSHANVSNNGALPGDIGARTGLTAGLSFASEPRLLGLGVEALYSQQGTSGDEIDYIDVPTYLRVMVPAPGLAPFAYAGPQISFEVRCRTGGAACPDTGRPSTTYAGVIGAGVRLGGVLSVEGRYIYGLQDLHLSTVTTGTSYQTRSFEILAGISF